jgi:hypothetical protein
MAAENVLERPSLRGVLIEGIVNSVLLVIADVITHDAAQVGFTEPDIFALVNRESERSPTNVKWSSGVS